MVSLQTIADDKHSSLPLQHDQRARKKVLYHGHLTSTVNSADASFNGMIEDDWPTITGYVPNSWISITLPEVLVVPRVKVFTYEVCFIL